MIQLTEREKSNLKRKDLDLHELLKLCSKPESIEDRVSMVQQCAELYPELKYFLVVAYFMKDAFSELNALGPLVYPPSRVSEGGSTENLRSMWKQVCRLYNTFPSGAKQKRAIAQQLLPYLYKDDAEIINQLIQGKFYHKDLNELVVQQAFPKDIPQDPKATS